MLLQDCNAAKHNDLALQRKPHYLIGPVLFDGPISGFLSRPIGNKRSERKSARFCISSIKATPTLSRLSREWRPPLAARWANPGPAFPRPSSSAASPPP